MKIKFWGVRGSTPTPDAENLRYGGNTPCIEVRIGGQIYILDCGTGLRSLGKSLAEEFKGEPIRAHILLTHFHWDHIQGIPFFIPLYASAQNEFHFHSSSKTYGLKHTLEEQMTNPYFPVEMSQMAGRRQFHEIDAGNMALDHCRIRAEWLNHPQGCLGFRIETAEGTVVYTTDTEPGNPAFDRSVRDLAAGADILITDAQFLPEDYEARRRGWGHSHWRAAIDIANDSRAKHLVLFHHDPDHSDERLDMIVRQASDHYASVCAAREGMEITV